MTGDGRGWIAAFLVGMMAWVVLGYCVYRLFN